ncbi:MAG: MOSC domain-containing protein [Deinococcota bacterium]
MPNLTMSQLRAQFPRPGSLTWLGLRSARKGEVISVSETRAEVGLGLVGDHRIEGKTPNHDSKRQVTLIQAEHLPVIMGLLGRDYEPFELAALLRRNLLVSGINLLALKDREFTIGEVRLVGSGPCAPCSRMEAALGHGGYNALRGHGGITARVLTAGVLRVGDVVNGDVEVMQPLQVT